ncbi:type II toxin-antitoxin system RelB/ParD family antitoxin [Lactococcus termiticola]|uniref:RelB antitoxin n=1 Tax=Lactococcus termiticola TaxID=2169526 RepID=A0A2R5HDV4_9LACT|nr:type II toxin-antitoxin system RelB/DinJ family antitoxin [Lactococcus termiticola]GBG96247.1 hypothetical protein NtB2_00358 [Lactococcus termiticola]
MENIAKNFQVSFKTDQKLVQEARQVFEEKNSNLTEIMNEFLQTVVETHDIPFETKEDRKRQKIIDELKAGIEESYQQYKEGKALSHEEVKERYGL